MTHADFVVHTLRNAIQESSGVDPAFKAAMDYAVRFEQSQLRVKALENRIGDFCRFVVDSDAEVGAGRDFHRAFDDLCESIGFDAEAYENEGFDREDV